MTWHQRPGPRVAAFLALGALKTLLAVKGLRTLREHGRALLAVEPVTVAGAERYLYLYMLVNALDEAKAVADVGYLLDIRHGSLRTHALALAGLSSEIVAPAYQLFSILKTLGWDKVQAGGSSVTAAAGRAPSAAARGCALVALVLTCAVRVPLSVGLSLLAARDTCIWASGGDTGEPGHEIQPVLMAPSALGGLFVLNLDIAWIRGWMLPKILDSGRRSALAVKID